MTRNTSRKAHTGGRHGPGRVALRKVAFSCYGLPIEVHAEAGLIPDVLSRLPPIRSRRKGETGRTYRLLTSANQVGSKEYVLQRSGRILVRSSDLSSALSTLEQDLQRYVAQHARHRIFLHAGVVSWMGRAILIPGRSHSGKSTLVAALVRAGARYYSDEYAVINSEGQVFPYPRPIALRGREAGNAGRRIPPERLNAGGRAGTQPIPAGLIVVTRYERGARWTPRRLSPGHGLLALLENAVAVRKRSEETLRALRAVVTDAVTLTTRRGEAKRVAQRILEYCRHCRTYARNRKGSLKRPPSFT